MSEESQRHLPLGNADAIESAAAAWLERREREDWSERDRVDLDGWLSESPTHAVAFLRIEDVWTRANRLRALGRPAQRNASPEVAKPDWPIFLRLAASLVVLAAVISASAIYFSGPRYQAYVTTIGGREKLSLSDGSVIELNTDTVLRISDDNRERRVWLDRGEAYFDIRHNDLEPFIVVAGGHRVTDIGTKFVVRNDPNRLEVRLMEGRARLESVNGSGRADVLNPGDVAIARFGSTTLVKRPIQDLTSELGWRHGLLIFHHTALADAAAEFNRYSREKIIVGDASAARATINGALPVGDLQEFTRMARNFFGLHSKKRGDTIVFTR